MPTYEKSMADDVKTYFADNDVAVPRQTLFADAFPDAKNDIVVVFNTGGLPPEQYYPIDHPTVQVAVYASAKNHAWGWDKIMECYRLLNRKQNITIGDSDVMFVRAMQQPSSMGFDKEKGRWLFVFNAQFKLRKAEGE